MYYLATISYETEVPGRNGDVRIKIEKEKYVIEADTIEVAIKVADNYRQGDDRESKSISVSELKIACVLTPKNVPQYYK